MGGVCRLGDRAKVPLDTHGCPACPHPDAQGPAITASNNVKVNGAGALREGDLGMHAACCGENTWKVEKGSSKVIVNGQPLVRRGDPTVHCGGKGKMIDASGNVVDGSGDHEEMQLREQILEWLERVRENGIAELLHMVSPGLGASYFVAGEMAKLFSPECRGTEYFKHLAKCLPSKPPGWDDRDPPPRYPIPAPSRYRPPHDPGAEPVSLFDPLNPVTDVVMLPFTAVRGAGVAVEGAAEAAPRVGRAAVDLAPKAGKWIAHGVTGGLGALAGAIP